MRIGNEQLRIRALDLGLWANQGLRAEFEWIREDPDSSAQLAAAKGYRLTRQEAEELLRSFDELSDEDLDQAAGGAWNDPPPPTGTGGTG